MNSTHKCEVIDVVLNRHDNADKLSIIPIYGGYTYVGNTEEWSQVKRAAWIPPDNLVDTTRPEFDFLINEKKYTHDGKSIYHRVKAKKLRGVQSYGLLVAVPPETPLGEDWAERLGVVHYVPEEHDQSLKTGLSSGECIAGPESPKYDLENFRKWGEKIFKPDDLVFVTEKIHGASSQYVFKDGQQFCGSRYEWKREFPTPPNPDEVEQHMRAKLSGRLSGNELNQRVKDCRAKIANYKPAQNMWWVAFRNCPAIGKFCENNPGYFLYGEVYGNVKGFRYGVTDGIVKFAAFDIRSPEGNWLSRDDFFKMCKDWDVPTVPVLCHERPFNFDELIKLAEGDSTMPNANHIREGIVVCTINETYTDGYRCKLKIVSDGYLEKG